MFNVNRRNNQFLYASTVVNDGEGSPIAEPLSSNTNTNTNSNTKTNTITNSNSAGTKHLAMAEPPVS